MVVISRSSYADLVYSHTGKKYIMNSGTSFLFYAEVVVLLAIVLWVPYTEIDWNTYMTQVERFMHGEKDYRELGGATGPLVYPAGFVWLFTGLYVITKRGTDVGLAQCLFGVLYLSMLHIVLKLHRVAGLSMLETIPLFLSKRIRSLFVLRLFNDCWAVWFALLAVVRLGTTRIELPSGSLSYRHWYWGSLLLSVAISIKMNILLFLPGLLCVMLYSIPLRHVCGCAALSLAWQVAVAAPFLLRSPEGYFSRAFELTRVFEQRWSVNYQFLPEEVFVAPLFHTGLLGAMLLAYALAWRWRWKKRCLETNAKMESVRLEIVKEAHTASTVQPAANSSPREMSCLPHILTLMESNMIGVAFSRSMHYQFYSWCFFSILFVLRHTKLPTFISVCLFWAVQFGFEVYPPSPLSSLVVTTGFAAIVCSIIFLGK